MSTSVINWNRLFGLPPLLDDFGLRRRFHSAFTTNVPLLSARGTETLELGRRLHHNILIVISVVIRHVNLIFHALVCETSCFVTCDLKNTSLRRCQLVACVKILNRLCLLGELQRTKRRKYAEPARFHTPLCERLDSRALLGIFLAFYFGFLYNSY